MTEDSPINPVGKKGMVRKEIAEMIMKEVKIGSHSINCQCSNFYGPGNEKSSLVETVFKNIKRAKA